MPPTRAKSKLKTTNDICPSCSTPADCCPHHPPKGADTDNVTPTQTQLKNSHNNDDKSLTKEESITMKTPLNLSGPKPMDNASGPYSQFLEARYGISPSVQLSESKKHLNFEELGEQIQTTKLNDMLCLSPMLDQMKTDVAHSINDAICSPNKELHGSINSLQMQELLAHSNVKTDFQDEILIQKLKTSIFVDVKGMSEEIVTSISTAAYDILQEVFSNAVPQILQENEILKSTLANLLSQVSELRKEILEIKNSQASFPVYPKHTSQAQNTTPSRCFQANQEWKSPEEDSDYEAEEAQMSINYLKEFPALPVSLQKEATASSTRNAPPTPLQRGWAIAASSLPVSNSKILKKEDKRYQVSQIEISGDLPDFETFDSSSKFLIPIINSRLCPTLLCNVQRELTQTDISNLVDITSYRKVKTWLVKFSNADFTQFIFENRRKLSAGQKLPLDCSFPKLFLNPNLSPEDKHQQIKVLKSFNKLKIIGEDNKSNFSVFPQGFSIKVVYESKKFFYSFDSRKSPQDFLKSNNIKFKE